MVAYGESIGVGEPLGFPGVLGGKMNPEILRQIAAQQVRDQRAQASRDRVARSLARALRGGHLAAVESDGYAIPAIPDYVDGTFTGAEAAPAARTAA
jgi:hypothetical protein